jgi:hypothetical protein
VPKLVWRVKLVAELRPGVMTETEVARIERDEQTGLAELGLRLDEAKQLDHPTILHALEVEGPELLGGEPVLDKVPRQSGDLLLILLILLAQLRP